MAERKDTKDQKEVKKEADVMCVVCRQDEMQTALKSKVKIPGSMICQDRGTPFLGKRISCWIYKNPGRNFENKFASAVMNTKIYGDAIIVSPSGITGSEIEEFMEAPTRSWAALAKEMPALVRSTSDKKTRPATAPAAAAAASHDYGDEDEDDHWENDDYDDDQDDDHDHGSDGREY